MASESETLNPSARIMTFYPTMDEFRNFSRYIAYIESQGAHRAGLAKVVPPKEWKPRASYDDIDDLVIPAPIQQLVTGQSGLFTQYNIQKKAMTVREFRKIANSDKYCTPRYSEFEELERKYWKNLTFNPPIYGADVNGTLYEKHVDEWNIGRLKTILDLVEKESGITIEGVNTPYLYFGMWKTSFAWHTEDMDLYSINYLHFGEPKSWYSVPPEHGKRLERLAKGFFPGSAQSCEAFLRHKMTLISPLMLKKYGIPFDKVTQEAGEFMITFPYGYHAGFNHGFNCAESTNFATHRWIEYGKQAVLCSCRKDMVKISMDVFVRKFQPERYKLWKAGKDSTVIDHTLPTPEAAEFLKESELPPRASSEEECPEEDLDGAEHGEEGDLKRSLAKHRIGTKRHRVCLEIPQEVSQSELFLKEELSSGQYEMTECQATLAPVRPTHSSVRQVEDGLPFPDYSDSTEVKFEELKNVKLEEEDEEEEQEAAALDLSVADEYMFSLEENKKSKGRRQPLCKLPRHHPLVLQECTSDDETSEQLTPEEEAEETEAWAKPLSQLWQNRPPNFEAEKEFNESMAQQAPHCAVCMIFQTYHQVEFGGLSQNCGNASELVSQQQRTKPLIPEMCFTSTGCSTDINLSTPYLEEDGTSILVSCKKCSVRVHASCYGVPPAKASEDWMCSRCSANALEEDCCLCSLRGGALQRANDDRWVHVSCAVAILEARFVNIAERSPVDVSKIPLPRFKLKCVFCKKRRKRNAGCCVQCSHGRCPTAFHVSCAQAAGVMMQPDDWPFVVFITCFRHRIPSLERAKGALQSITAGQKVISKHKNGRFYQCEVVRLTTETFYEVNFDDGSFSDNLYPEDIVSHDCLQLGPPAEGEVVQVRWTDGQVYGAKFVASHPIQMYQVEFEDGSQLVVKRDDVYTLDEELPKRVKSRLSVASDMRFNEIFTEKEVKQEKKRQRVINSRYREDYIEPALYRAIME
ncbi:lysine-specific demethylase 4A [Octodon degus]|uniref:Lysine-specific demethylase 4A n=1 Tax=Octodon degus TaxID=10160 RepID=A0A6P6DUH9_OCTDE|nr:lysine-specific demethylase 4A [Octodon degus]XP_023563624.1 lysine-specific demethylase 4A [Octodon degus]XP_023563625.1 lysine-specific demethylase 4A [Octodon degus]XP_023563626.1 lysine-specific demethylase 4A [Octodon degus]XP_023563627.1 lysine-specific demethylase 4A [Octodon degus]